jgi:hypothetical protein
MPSEANSIRQIMVTTEQEDFFISLKTHKNGVFCEFFDVLGNRVAPTVTLGKNREEEGFK